MNKMNQSKSRSYEMKALGGGGNTFSYGTQSKNLFNGSLKEKIRATYIISNLITWKSLPNVETSRYGKNWEFQTMPAGIGGLIDRRAIFCPKSNVCPSDSKIFLLIADNVDNSGGSHILGIAYDENFKSNFESVFGIRYDDWAKISEDLFSQGVNS